MKTSTTTIIMIVSLFVATACFAQTPVNPMKIEPQVIKPVEPETFEDKLAMAGIAVLGTVTNIVPEDNSDQSQRLTRRPYIASIKVEKVFKGSPGDKTIRVRFLKDNTSSVPPLTDLSQGERAVFFLTAAAGEKYLSFITPFSGKAAPDESLISKLETASNQFGLTAAVEASISIVSGVSGEPAAEYVLRNTGAQAVVFNATPDPAAIITLAAPDGTVLSAPPESYDRSAAAYPLRLSPGAFYGFRVDLGPTFKRSPPGTYTISATFNAPEGNDPSAFTGTISAKPVAFTVK